jgi:hypothetical protein
MVHTNKQELITEMLLVRANDGLNFEFMPRNTNNGIKA